MYSFKKIKKGYISLEVVVILGMALTIASMAFSRSTRVYSITQLQEQEILKEMSES